MKVPEVLGVVGFLCLCLQSSLGEQITMKGKPYMSHISVVNSIIDVIAKVRYLVWNQTALSSFLFQSYGNVADKITDDYNLKLKNIFNYDSLSLIPDIFAFLSSADLLAVRL